MIQSEDIQSKNGNLRNLNFMFKSIFNSYAHLFYETTFVANIKNGDIDCLSLHSDLNRSFSQYQFQKKSLQFMVEAISGRQGVAQFSKATKMIADEIKKMNDNEKDNVIFFIDLPMTLNEGKNYATYRISPLSQDYEGELNHIVVAICYSTCKLINKMLVTNLATGEKRVYDFDKKTWSNFITPSLSAIEKSVLGLSAQGLSVNEIATELNKSVDTIKSVRKRIFAKLEVDNITRAIMEASSLRLI